MLNTAFGPYVITLPRIPLGPSPNAAVNELMKYFSFSNSRLDSVELSRRKPTSAMTLHRVSVGRGLAASKKTLKYYDNIFILSSAGHIPSLRFFLLLIFPGNPTARVAILGW